MSKQHVHGRGPLEMDKLLQWYALAGYLVIHIDGLNNDAFIFFFQDVLIPCQVEK